MTSMNTNRVAHAIDIMTPIIAEMDAATITTLEAETHLDSADLLDLGPAATLFLAHGVINVDEAQTLHVIRSTYSTRTLAEKMVFMKAMADYGTQI